MNLNPLKNYFDIICGELPRDQLVSVILPDGQVELLAVMVDVEMDPFRVTFDRDRGDALIHADGQKCHMLSAEQLWILAGLSERAKDIWERWHNGEDHLRIWLAMGDSGADLRRGPP
ncbi:MAG: hypothetical protein JJU15_18920 [Pararhodobacter sp.]|nr:hypothetical protein [Pararhodobacter sp.]